MTKTNSRILSVFLLLASIIAYSIAYPVAFAAKAPPVISYSIRVEIDAKGFKHSTSTFTVGENNPGSTFLPLADGTYVYQFNPHEGTQAGRKGIVVGIISGLVPDAKVGSNLSYVEMMAEDGKDSFTLSRSDKAGKEILKLEVHVTKVDAPATK